MELGMNIQQQQAMKNVMTPQLRQAISMLHMSSFELLEELKQKRDENPFIEMSESLASFKEPTSFWRDIENSAATPEVTLEQHLVSQISLLKLPPEIVALCSYLAGSLNEQGYLDESIGYYAQLLGVEMELLQEALAVLQSLDPAGIGAQSLQECLLLQIERNPEKNAIAHTLVRYHFELVINNRIDKLITVTGARTVVHKKGTCLYFFP